MYCWVQEGVSKFNLKPKQLGYQLPSSPGLPVASGRRGLEHLKRAGLVENEDPGAGPGSRGEPGSRGSRGSSAPGSLAKLFRNTEIGLDKTTIGGERAFSLGRQLYDMGHFSRSASGDYLGEERSRL